MLQHAKVIRIIDDKRAEISVVRESACGHDCASCGGCGMASAPVTAEAENIVNARVGDSVTVETDTTAVIGIAAVVYLCPLVLFFAVYILCKVCGLGEGSAIALSAAGFVGGIFCALMLNRRVGKNKSVTVKIISVDSGEN